MKAFLYQNTQNIIMNSSSGGAFRKIIQLLSTENDLIVYGAIWNTNNEIVHARVDASNEEQLKKFSGSKYSRSKLNNTYKNIKDDLEAGRTVLFSGTACQVAGLKNFLQFYKCVTERLYTVDIICHGTVMPKLLRAYIEWLEKKYNCRISSINFRDKRIGWHGYPTSIKFSNGKELIHTYDTQLFKRIFFSNFGLAPSCYTCPYSNLNRVSDVTIGDYWGMQAEFPEIKENKGASLVLFNTKKGEKLQKLFCNSISCNETMKESADNLYLNYQHNLNKPTDKPIGRDYFINDFLNMDFDKFIRKYQFYTISGKIKFDIKVLLTKLKLYNKAF